MAGFTIIAMSRITTRPPAMVKISPLSTRTTGMFLIKIVMICTMQVQKP